MILGIAAILTEVFSFMHHFIDKKLILLVALAAISVVLGHFGSFTALNFTW